MYPSHAPDPCPTEYICHTENFSQHCQYENDFFHIWQNPWLQNFKSVQPQCYKELLQLLLLERSDCSPPGSLHVQAHTEDLQSNQIVPNKGFRPVPFSLLFPLGPPCLLVSCSDFLLVCLNLFLPFPRTYFFFPISVSEWKRISFSLHR